MKLKKKSLRLGQVLCVTFIVFLIFSFCEIPVANAQTPQQIAKKALAATVLLVMEDEKGKPLGLGSGFFVDTNLIATNFHVIEGATRGTAKLVGQETEYNIEGITAMDETNDLAILQVSVPSVQPLSLGDSDTVEIGDRIYVAGNPKGYLEGTFSDGVISGIRGSVGEKRLQMTAPISPGSSGGPVLNGTGKVIGISVMTVEGGQNLNFAIPSSHLKTLVATVGTAIPLSEGTSSISADTYLLRGRMKAESGNYKGAIADYDKAIRLKPDAALIYYSRGLAKSNLGHHAAAIADFDTVIHLLPNFAGAYETRGWEKEKLGQYAAAIVDFDVVIRLKPNDALAYFNRGGAKYQLGQYFAAITDFDTSIRLKPDYALAYVDRGMAKARLNQYVAAIADFDIAIQLKSDYAFIYICRGNAKHDLGQHVAAIADFDTAIRLNPDDAFAYVCRGVSKYKRSRTWEAKQDFQIARKLAEQAGDEDLKAHIKATVESLY